MTSRQLEFYTAPVAARLPHRVRRHIWYLQKFKRIGRFRRPVTFTEKVNWRILHDRRPVLAWTCDKLRMKEEASGQGIVTARSYWAGTDLAELVDVQLPERWVLKPNHRSQLIYLGHGSVCERDLPGLRAATHGWLEDIHSTIRGEWAYSQARHCLLLEEMIGGGDVSPPNYKFFVFDGRPYVLYVDSVRDGEEFVRFYTPGWQPLPYYCGYRLGAVTDPPSTLDEMLEVASRLAAPFDFIRIDLYSVGGTVYFGEYTPYPNGGVQPYLPRSWDREMGAMWRLPSLG